jgi:protein-tyrosine phosphatase
MDEEPRGLPAYERALAELAREREQPCVLQRFGIEDCSVPSREEMDRIVAAIDGELARGRAVYAHCWGGRGRAGIVAGVFLIRGGLATADDVLEVIGRLRGRDPRTHPSPETAEQLGFVKRYTAARR